MVMINAAKSVSQKEVFYFKNILHQYVAENPDACVTAAEIYECGMENQMVMTYNMTEVGEGNSTKVCILKQILKSLLSLIFLIYTVLFSRWLRKSKALLLDATDRAM